MPKGHIGSLDWLRGIAALMVCFYHFAYANEDYLANDNILKNLSQYGYLGVDIFFVISGFIIPYSMHRAGFKLNRYGKFILRRFIRIEPPYLISILLFLFVAWISTFSSYYKGDIFHIQYPVLISHVGYFTSLLGYDWINPVYWTLAIEFQYYLIVGLLIYFLSQEGKKIMIYCTICIMLLASHLIPENNLVFNYFPLFLAGIISFQYKLKIINKVEFAIFATATFFALYLNFPFPTLIAVLFAFIFINWISFETRISRFLGNISYSLYLVHLPIGSKFVNYSENFIQNDNYRSLFIFLAIGITMVFAWFFYRLFERPFQLISKRIKY
jgi:peptidoglycan/LPS O-acetylase OafA/YrhL